MSASREKKQRQQTEGLTEKQRQEAREAQKAKTRKTIYIVVGVVIAVLVAALLIWSSGFFQRRTSAATVGDREFTSAEVSYYYHSVLNNTINMTNTYAQYGISTGYDTSKSPSEQIYDEETGETYAEHFMSSALDTLQWAVVLSSEAEKAGYILSEDGQAELEATLASIDTYRAEGGYSRSAYLKMLYGSFVDEKIFTEQLKMNLLASEYETYYQDQMEYTSEELEAYYSEHGADLDTYAYRYCFISGEAVPETDDEGNEIEPTEEQTAAAMAAAKEKADAMVARVEAGEDFNTVAAEYVAESLASNYTDDPEYNLYPHTLGSNLSSTYGSWLKEEGRKAGDVGIVETDTGYYIVTLLGRHRAEDDTVNVRHILVLAETTEPAEDSEETTALPTEEQLAAAKTAAQALLDQWKSGQATEDSFAQLATEHSEDPGSKDNGGLYEDVTQDYMIPSFNDWIFDASRQSGDTGIVENTNSSGDVLGYHVMYYVGHGTPQWQVNSTSALRSADYETWYEETKANYPLSSSEKGLAAAQ
jgi:hypothetical protein